MKAKGITSLVVTLLVLYVICYEGIWKWGFCRVYVSQGQSLLVMYKGNLLPLWPNPPNAQGEFAKVEDGKPLERGFLREILGPGRHFRYDPIHYNRILIPDVIIEPGQVGMVTSRLGKELPPGQILVDGDVGETEYKGVMRKVLKPGRYRINLYGYEIAIFDDAGKKVEEISLDSIAAGYFRRSPQPEEDQSAAPHAGQHDLVGKKSGWVNIPPGYVGVVTNLVEDNEQKAGIQEEVLQPGIYAINPREQQVDIVEIGFRGITINADLAKSPDGKIEIDENGEPVLAKGGNPGINFPSNDGFPISLDFTCIWGIMPEQASKVVELFGNVGEVENTVIVPEIESICRIHGSKLGAVDLLAGDSREEFQRSVSEDFRTILSGKNISLQVGLVRHIYIPAEVRGPIQKANIADELKLTRDTEIETAKVEADLEAAKANVTKEEKKVLAETEKLYQEALALGHKEVEEIEAATEKLVAAIAKETAEIEAQSLVVLGEAEAQVETMRQEATAQKFELAVQAFGSPEAYNQWVFATGLPDNLRLILLYAGEGTFWTDLKGFQETALGKMLQGQAGAKTPAKPKTSVRSKASVRSSAGARSNRP